MPGSLDPRQASPVRLVLVWAVVLVAAAIVSKLVVGGHVVLLAFVLLAMGGALFILRRLELAVVLLLGFAFFYAPIKDFFLNVLVFFLVDMLVLMILVAWAGGKIVRRERLFRPSPLRVPALLLVGYSMLLLFNLDQHILGSLAGLRAWGFFMLLYFVGYDVFDTPRKVDRLLDVLLALGTAAALYGFYQHLRGLEHFYAAAEANPGFAQRHANFEYKDEFGRPVLRIFSTMVSSAELGINMALISLFGMVRLWRGGMSRVRGILTAGAVVCMFGALVLTGSRTSWGVFLLMTGVLLFLVRNRWAVMTGATMVVIGITVGWFLSGGEIANRMATLTTETVVERLGRHHLRGFSIAAEHPFGRGLGYTAGIPDYIRRQFGLETQNMDSEWGRAAAELGFPGFALFVFLWAAMLWAAWRGLRRVRLRRYKPYAVMVACMVAGLFLAEWTGPAMLGLPHILYWWLMLGAFFRMMDREAAERRQGAAAVESVAGGAGGGRPEADRRAGGVSRVGFRPGSRSGSRRREDRD